VIYLDIDYMEGYRIFTWSQKNFPDPKKMVGDLARDGFKTVVIVDPGIKVDTTYHAYQTGLKEDLFLKYPDGRTYIGKVWPGACAFPDFTMTAARTWWGRSFDVLTTVGVRGFWNDMNEPSVFDVPLKTIDLEVLHDDNGLRTSHTKNHNLYGMLMTRATYEGVRQLRSNERPFVLTRASYAGGQRYSAAWTGDNIASWEHLEIAVPMMLNLGISGQPFVGTDIGGFVGSPDGELYARWLQLGVFSPLMRTHTAWGTRDQEPWSYGARYTAINKAMIELRYKLLPYLYNVMVEASETGIPAMRPLAFEYPGDTHSRGNGSEFLFGDDLLIAPVLWPGAKKRDLRLPRGTWYDFWTGKRFQGSSNVTVDAPIDRIPVFARAGAIIPTQQIVQHSDQAPINPLTFAIYPSDSSARVYYEDDGLTFDYQKGAYLRRVITQRKGASSCEIVIGEAEGSYRPPARSCVLQILDFAASPTRVRTMSEELPRISIASLQVAPAGWAYDAAAKVLWVKSPDVWGRQVFSIVQ
jgi:alpha-glucosidase